MSKASESLFIKIKKNQKKIPSKILENSSLKHLELFALHADIELTPLSQLKRLESLSLQIPYNSDFPTWALTLPCLRSLKIKKSLIKSIDLPDGDLAPLEKITLTQMELHSLPQDFGRFYHLKEIDFSQNQLFDLPKSLGLATEIKRINLDQNLFQKVPDCIFRFEDLIHLSMDQNPLADKEKQKLFDAFKMWF